jgi:phosphoribosyl 1,2-cyclic phosphodiesterase
MFTFVIRGTRGTSTMCGKNFLRYGGHTTCFSVHSSEGTIVIDAGSGIVNLCRDIQQHKGNHDITMLFTHFHLDHIIGLPSFLPLYEKESKISIMADPRRPENWKQTLTTFMSKPYWPVKLGETQSALEFKDLPVDIGSMTVYGLRISWFRVPHPQQSLSFKIEDGTKSIVVATDVEYECGKADPAFINFCKNCDHLIFDSQYTEDEYKHFKGWGHSTWNTGVSIAKSASAKQLVLFHHLPDRTDDEIDSIVKEARNVFPVTEAAHPNMTL